MYANYQSPCIMTSYVHDYIELRGKVVEYAVMYGYFERCMNALYHNAEPKWQEVILPYTAERYIASTNFHSPLIVLC